MGESEVRYYRVSPKFWVDNTHWSDDTRLLSLYLLTSPHRNTEGLFRLPKPYAMGDLGWTAERFAEPFAQLLADGFIEYDEAAQVVLIVHAMKYQQCANENVAKAAVKRLNELPNTWLTRRFKQLAERFDERLAKRLPEGFGVVTPNTPTPTPALAPTPTPTSGEGDVEPPPVVAEPTKSMRDFVADLNRKGVKADSHDPRGQQYRTYVHAGLGEVQGLQPQRGIVLMALRSYAGELGAPLAKGEADHLAGMCGNYGPAETFDAFLEAVSWGAGLSDEHRGDRSRTKYATAVLKGERERGAT